MGVYLKGLTEEDFKSVSWECTYKALKRQGRIIEIAEPHGRLIDADAMMKKLQGSHDFYIEAWGSFSEMPAKDKARVDEISACMANVVNARTIIEAEVE